jgi:signal transducer and activator of transcription 5B
MYCPISSDLSLSFWKLLSRGSFSLFQNCRLLNFDHLSVILFVCSTFVIENQPPQVLKTCSRFSATARSLIGSRLNLHMTLPQVSVTIVSEEQARGIVREEAMVREHQARQMAGEDMPSIMNEHKAHHATSGEILNNQGTMEYHQASGKLGITFRNMVRRLGV